MTINSQWYLQSNPWPLIELNTDGEVIFANNEYARVFSVDTDKIKGKKITKIFNDYRGKIYDSMFTECLKSKELVTFGEYINDKYAENKMFPIFDDKNNIVSVVNMVVNSTEEKQKAQELEANRDILRTIIDSIPDVIFYKNANSEYIGCNKKFSDFYKELGIKSVLGKTDLEIYPDKETANYFIQEDQDIIKTKEPHIRIEWRKDKKGNKVYEENSKVPVIGKDGKVWGIVGLSRDITNQKTIEEKLRYLSYTDALTGVYNRTCFEEKLQELNKDMYLPMGIIMGDVNGLKIVNDSLGHLEGDRFLKRISSVLKDTINDKGYVFRWGGDEFVVLLPNTNEYACEKIINTINKELKKEKFNDCIDLSMAMGEKVKISVDEDSRDLLKEVEERVYRQKLLEKTSVRSSMMNSLKESLEAKNMETEEHTERVEHYAYVIGKRLRLKNSDMDELIIAARLHDIGKIGIDEEILLKPGRLTEEEFRIMKTHTEKGYRIINASSELVNVARCVLTHHERWDGTGYPLGIKGEEIPLMARIISVADAYDVMTHYRVYKNTMSNERAIEELKRCSGTQFDPEIVRIFLEYLSEKDK